MLSRLARSFTLQLYRHYLPYMTIGSIWRIRRFLLEFNDIGRDVGYPFVRVRLKKPFRGDIYLSTYGQDVFSLTEIFYEQVYRVCLERLGPCSSIIDLGANVGMSTLYFRIKYPQARILAVEPHPGNFQLLTRNLERVMRGGEVHTLCAAVWDKPCKLAVTKETESHWNTGFRFEECPPVCDSGIEGLPVGDIVQRSGFDHVDLLKVDVEGAETRMFQGDLDWLSKVKAIAIEFHETSRQDSGFDAIMSDHGYDLTESGGHTTLAVRR